MKRVTGIGGLFFKAKDPQALGAWYKQHLGIDVQPLGGAAFDWTVPDNPDGVGTTAWSLFAQTSDHFAPSTAPFMINYRVHDLHALLAALRTEGVRIEGELQESEYGKFGWIVDPEGNKVELWEPPAGQ